MRVCNIAHGTIRQVILNSWSKRNHCMRRQFMIPTFISLAMFSWSSSTVTRYRRCVGETVCRQHKGKAHSLSDSAAHDIDVSPRNSHWSWQRRVGQTDGTGQRPRRSRMMNKTGSWSPMLESSVSKTQRAGCVAVPSRNDVTGTAHRSFVTWGIATPHTPPLL